MKGLKNQGATSADDRESLISSSNVKSHGRDQYSPSYHHVKEPAVHPIVMPMRMAVPGESTRLKEKKYER